MSKYCGPSPCDGLLAARAHGRWLFDSTPDQPLASWVMTVSAPHKQERLEIQYCPFCGTKLDQRRPRDRGDFLKTRTPRAQEN